MKVTINAPVISVTPPVTIPSKSGGNDYTKCELILDDSHGNYQNIIVVEFGGDKISLVDGLVAGQMVTVEAFLSSREWQGKYFTSLKGNSVNVQGQTTPQGRTIPIAQPYPNPPQTYPQNPPQGYYAAPTPGTPAYQQPPVQRKMFP